MIKKKDENRFFSQHSMNDLKSISDINDEESDAGLRLNHLSSKMNKLEFEVKTIEQLNLRISK